MHLQTSGFRPHLIAEAKYTVNMPEPSLMEMMEDEEGVPPAATPAASGSDDGGDEDEDEEDDEDDEQADVDDDLLDELDAELGDGEDGDGDGGEQDEPGALCCCRMLCAYLRCSTPPPPPPPLPGSHARAQHARAEAFRHELRTDTAEPGTAEPGTLPSTMDPGTLPGTLPQPADYGTPGTGLTAATPEPTEPDGKVGEEDLDDDDDAYEQAGPSAGFPGAEMQSSLPEEMLVRRTRGHANLEAPSESLIQKRKQLEKCAFVVNMGHMFLHTCVVKACSCLT